MTRGLTKDGIAPEEAIKAYLLDVTMFINPPLTANGSILQMSAKEARTFFEFGSTLATKSPRPILETISQNAQLSITDALFFPASAGSRTARVELIHMEEILEGIAASFHSITTGKCMKLALLTVLQKNGAQQPKITLKIASGDFVLTKCYD